MKTCDLHTHSVFSDGSLTPTQLVSLAGSVGLNAVALTDHNTAKGLPEFMTAGREQGVLTVPGCEFSTEYEGVELHVVGLFLPESVWPEIEAHVEMMEIAKHNSNLKLLEKLRAAGYEVTYEEAAANTEGKEINRAHIARVLISKGYFPDTVAAFSSVLSEAYGMYEPPKRLGTLSTIKFINMYGGVSVLAHPYLEKNDRDTITSFLPAFRDAGLMAIETLYSTYSSETVRYAEEQADRFGFLRSGGSDFHGEAKKNIALGTGRGSLCVPFEYYETLSRAAKRD